MNDRHHRWTRREVLTRGAGMTGALLAAPAALATGLTEVQAKGVNFVGDRKALKGTISMASANYAPSASMVKSANNPTPHHNLRVVANAYEKLHPGVKVNLITVPASSDPNYFREWVVTQMVGNTEPDIVWDQSVTINNDVTSGKDWWTSLTKYLNQPNPYIKKGQPGAEKWIDEFYPAPTSAKQATDGNYYCIPFDLVTTFFFYNKTEFNKLGLKAPATYTEYLHVLEKLKKAGKVPTSGLSWGIYQMMEMVNQSWRSKVKATGPGGAYLQKDVDLAIVNGIIKPDSDQFRNYLQVMKESVPYWQSDWTTVAATENEIRFSTGELMILEATTGEYAVLKYEKPSFEWGTFFIPSVTKGKGPGESPYADGKPAPPVGGASGEEWGITKNARQNGTVELCVDFLRYLTEPTNASKIINEVGQLVPNEKQATVSPSLRKALTAVIDSVGQNGMLSWINAWLPPQSVTEVSNAIDGFLLGKATAEAASTNIQSIYMTAAQGLVQQNGWTG